jgi:hypothetical protein
MSKFQRRYCQMLGVCVTYKMGFGFDDWIYWHLILTTRDYRKLQRYLWSTVQYYTHTRVLSLHWSYPGNGFITVSLSLQITHEVFFSHSNSFLTIILQMPIPKTRRSSIPLLPTSHPGRLASRNSTQFFSTELFFIITLDGTHRKYSLSIDEKACL